MLEILNSFNKKPSQKFQQQLINFEKPQNFSKTPKPKSKCMKKREKKNTYQVVWSKERPKITWVEGLEGEESV